MIAFFFCVLPMLDPNLQAVAEERVEYMQQHHHCWHPPFRIGRLWGVHGGVRARFEGAGWGRAGLDPKRLGTCRPRRRRLTLAADAVASGPRGTYRIRIWK